MTMAPRERQPRAWVFAGGAALTATAGFVNTLLLLSAAHVPVSHMSGAVTTFGIEIMQGGQGHLAVVVSVILGFVLGAIASGLIIGNQRLRPGRHYGVALIIEGIAFAVAGWGWNTLALAAFGCGLQNGMASSYLGLVIRTTHVTGIVTDIGVLIGNGLRNQQIQWWKLILLACLLVGFVLGGVMAVLCHRHWGQDALYVVAAGVTAAGLWYFAYWHRRRTDSPAK